MFLRFLEGGGEWGCQGNDDQGFLEWASVVFGRGGEAEEAREEEAFPGASGSRKDHGRIFVPC